ncbi:hypothetical protein F5Y18DRAFT_305531 [Xylariaceae sp. FL1019]|nr:hypothetical protein F5Y18DRAFT_305531 [Xylariaceae sp. FL1019]
MTMDAMVHPSSAKTLCDILSSSRRRLVSSISDVRGWTRMVQLSGSRHAGRANRIDFPLPVAATLTTTLSVFIAYEHPIVQSTEEPVAEAEAPGDKDEPHEPVEEGVTYGTKQDYLNVAYTNIAPMSDMDIYLFAADVKFAAHSPVLFFEHRGDHIQMMSRWQKWPTLMLRDQFLSSITKW